MKRVPELDGIRGLAGVGVVAYHAFPTALYWCWSCVDLFFVLSRYLIISIIITQRSQPGFLRSFYVRRVARIWPAYFITLVTLVLINSISRTGHSTEGLLYHLVFLQNTPAYFGVQPPPFIHSFSPSWSVAIEEQFYLIWPVLVIAITPRKIPHLAVVLLGLCLFCRLTLPGEIFLLLTRGDGLALGCFLGWLDYGDGESSSLRRHVPWLAIAALFGGGYVALYLVVFRGEPRPGWQTSCFTGFSLLYFSLIGFCISFSGSRALFVFRIPLLRWFGTISYSLYLFHIPIFTIAPRILELIGVFSPTVSAAATWIAIVVLPAISWYLVERPILRFSRPSLHTAVRADDTLACRIPN